MAEVKCEDLSMDEFATNGGGVSKGGTVTLHTGDTKIGESRIERTQRYIFSFDEAAARRGA